ncbi:MAG: type II toxin-antitoxin system VapC family toxin [Byssovorax sp.]
MKFLFDANVYFALLHDPRAFTRHRNDLARIGPRLFLSSVVRAELLQGAKGELGRARVNRATRSLEQAGRVVSPTHDDWVTAGTVQGKIWDDAPALRSKRLLHDILIVCAARRIGAVVVAENTADFSLICEYLVHRAVTMDEIAGALSAR